MIGELRLQALCFGVMMKRNNKPLGESAFLFNQ
jgi:hypothetical protein